MDMLDNNTFPPNVSLSPMNNTYLPSTTHMDTNSMMMYSQQTPTHIQHHQNQNQIFRHRLYCFNLRSTGHIPESQLSPKKANNHAGTFKQRKSFSSRCEDATRAG